MRRQVKHRILSTTIMLFLSISAWALFTDPPGPVVPPPHGLVVPIDENIYLLAIAGLALGIYFLRKRKIS